MHHISLTFCYAEMNSPEVKHFSSVVGNIDLFLVKKPELINIKYKFFFYHPGFTYVVLHFFAVVGWWILDIFSP